MKLGFVSDSLGAMPFADMLLNSLEGLGKSVTLPQGVMPAAADYKPQAI